MKRFAFLVVAIVLASVLTITSFVYAEPTPLPSPPQQVAQTATPSISHEIYEGFQ